jgi:integrase
MKLELRGLLKERLPSGAYRYRVRVKGQKKRRIALKVGPDQPDFMEHYLAARMGREFTVAEELPAIENSLAELSLAFESWMHKMVKAGRMSPYTLQQRASFLARLRKEHGDKSALMPRHHVIRIRDAMIETPGAADNMVKAIRAMYTWAIDDGRVSENPALGIGKVNEGTGAIPWSVEDLRQFRERHPLGTMAHLSLTMFMFLACRLADAPILGRGHEKLVDDVRFIGWQPGKKGSAYVSVPILPPLARAIASQKVAGPTFLLNTYGRSFASSNAFSNKFRVWVHEAGLTDRSPHGIRKAAGELMALEGASQYHIMCVHGHTQAKTSEVYTRGVDRQRLAAEAMKLLAAMDW